jgi:predicted RNA-binding protein with PUA-like domain
MVAVSGDNRHDERPAVKPAPRGCWLVKFAPFRTSWAEIVRRGSFTLRGVRSRAARKHLSEMRTGDEVLFYHSQQELAVMGLMEVVRPAYPDPTSLDPAWLTCDFRPVRSFSHPVPLAAIKADNRLSSLPLVRQPRLAVMPVPPTAFNTICSIGGGETPATSEECKAKNHFPGLSVPDRLEVVEGQKLEELGVRTQA